MRRLTKAPQFYLPVIISLALGIGIMGAAYALIDAVLLRPLPYPGSDRLVALGHTARGGELAQTGLSAGTFLHYREYNRAFQDVAAFVKREYTITSPGAPEEVEVVLVTPNLLSMLGAEAHLGRLPASDDEQGEVGFLVFISHGLWVDRYGSDPDILGKPIEIDRRQDVIAGVMQPGFAFPDPEIRIWITFPQRSNRANIRGQYLSGIGMLRQGYSPGDAEQDLQRLITSLPDAYGDVTSQDLQELGFRARVVPWKEALIGDVRAPLRLLAATAAFLLLITWVNSTNLALIRAEQEGRHAAVMRALGASERRLAARYFGEAILLVAVGGVLAVILARVTIALRFGFAPEQVPRLEGLALNAETSWLILVLSVVSGVLLGGVLFFRVRRGHLTSMLASVGARSTTGPRQLVGRRVLIAAQLALTLTLLIGAALMARSLWHLQRADLGFNTEGKGILTFYPPLHPAVYGSYRSSADVHARILERLRALPSVSGAEAVSISAFPLTEVASFWKQSIAVEGRQLGKGEDWPAALFAFTTPGYFRAFGIPLVQGRTFRSGDMNGYSPSVILSQSLAGALFGERNPIGQRVRWAETDRYPAYTVVGVVGDVMASTIREGPSRVVYFPNISPPEADSVTLVLLSYIPQDEVYIVESSVAPQSLIPAVRQAVQAVDPKLLPTRFASIEEVVGNASARSRLLMLLLLSAAGTALALGVIGIYGVLTYAVARRTPELGIRMAMGASPGTITRMVVADGLVMGISGIGVGLAGALLLTRFLESILYEIGRVDPLSFTSTAALLLIVVVLGSYLPARRAGRIDPARTLTSE